jgi:hypothetical protein
MDIETLVGDRFFIINYIKYLKNEYRNKNLCYNQIDYNIYSEIYSIKKILEKKIKNESGIVKEKYLQSMKVCDDYLSLFEYLSI